MEMSSKASAAAGKRNKKSKGGNGPSPQVVRYNGPVRLPNKDEQMTLVNLAISIPLTTTSSGGTATFSTVLSSADVTSATDWGDFKTLYQEARVVGMQAKFLPKLKHAIAASAVPATTGVNQAGAVSPLYLCVAHGESTALASLDAAVNHFTRKECAINDGMVVDIKMKETDEAQWFSTQSGTVNVMSIKPFFTAATAGATDVVAWGTLIQTFAVQFRTRSLTATAVKSSQIVRKDDSKDVKAPKEKSWF